MVCKAILAIIAALAICCVGCTRGPLPHEQVLEYYQPGVKRADLLGAEPDPDFIQSVDRPAKGWRSVENDPLSICERAAGVEDRMDVTVAHVDMVPVFRFAYASDMMPGLYHDYLFFDSQGGLITYERQFVD
ncbi:hypothetical protein KQI84_08155 [bacterium]|nr:hypothetical protein [bacterium]